MKVGHNGQPHGQCMELGNGKMKVGGGLLRIGKISAPSKMILYGGMGKDLWTYLGQPFLKSINRGGRNNGRPEPPEATSSGRKK